ncbi:hypothetical protein ANCCAN_14364 [Ancylostoma caninum]|uniref:Uncharacterized protein n=1 Tax=Ancylostoma caninum TaxID=29170 RepID=A0A368G5I4_ANCCA|nr:hypothetical protein ANCCAN_14364 [Ancylostoma caninum]
MHAEILCRSTTSESFIIGDRQICRLLTSAVDRSMRYLLCGLVIVAALKSQYLRVCPCISTVSPEDTGCVNIQLLLYPFFRILK